LPGEAIDELFKEFKAHADREGAVTSSWLAEFLDRRMGLTPGRRA
jgi:hypothetical protein